MTSGFNWRASICWVLAAILGWSGVLKALEPATFAESILGFRLVPWGWAVALAHYLPWLEIVTAAGLLITRWRTSALVIACGLFALFSVIWAITGLRGIDVVCGCFGSDSPTSAIWGFTRGVALAGFAAWALRGEMSRR